MAKKHGHHGGAWKVAYADFVTAMMALFLVLWLTAQDEKVKAAIERSFRNPFASLVPASPGFIVNKDPQKVDSSKGTSDAAASVELQFLRQLNDVLKVDMNEIDQQEAVKMELLSDGIRLSLFDRARKPLFKKDSPELTEYGDWILGTMAWVISRFEKFQIELEGHSEARTEVDLGELDLWELTAVRANVARKKLLTNGVKTAQIKKVAGYSDTVPVSGTSRADQSNRRVTILLQSRAKN